MKITTTQTKLIKKLESIAKEYGFDLIAEKLVCHRKDSKWQILYQVTDEFETVLEVELYFHEVGYFKVDIDSKYDILPSRDVRFTQIDPNEGDRISEVLELIKDALQTFLDAPKLREETEDEE